MFHWGAQITKQAELKELHLSPVAGLTVTRVRGRRLMSDCGKVICLPSPVGSERAALSARSAGGGKEREGDYGGRDQGRDL